MNPAALSPSACEVAQQPTHPFPQSHGQVAFLPNVVSHPQHIRGSPAELYLVDQISNGAPVVVFVHKLQLCLGGISHGGEAASRVVCLPLKQPHHVDLGPPSAQAEIVLVPTRGKPPGVRAAHRTPLACGLAVHGVGAARRGRARINKQAKVVPVGLDGKVVSPEGGGQRHGRVLFVCVRTARTRLGSSSA